MNISLNEEEPNVTMPDSLLWEQGYVVCSPELVDLLPLFCKCNEYSDQCQGVCLLSQDDDILPGFPPTYCKCHKSGMMSL